VADLTVYEKRTGTTCRRLAGERAVLARPVERVEELFE
jgi:hypothetical protein